MEAKAAHTGTLPDLYKPVSAFANQSGGGLLLFGLNEDTGFKVVGVGNPRKLQEDLSIFKVKKEMKKGKEHEYWHVAWMIDGKTHNMYLGSCKKVSTRRRWPRRGRRRRRSWVLKSDICILGKILRISDADKLH